ncbi:MAG: YfhO family protein [bacterium]|nr:YfhO family protein [bacterium]
MPDQVDHTSTNSFPAIHRAIELSDLAPILGLILLTLALYYPLLLGIPVMPDTWERFEPWNTELGFSGPNDPSILHYDYDASLQYIPWDKFAHDELRAGRIPAWDPYCLGGVPLLQNHLVPVYYPVYALIAWLFPPLMILGVSGFFHTLLMAIFFYLFLREWLGNRVASWAAASFLVVSLIPAPHHQPWPLTYSIFPVIWFFYERWLKHRSPWAGLWMALCWAALLIAGYPTIIIQFGLFTIVWFFVRAGMIGRDSRPSWRASFLMLLLPFLLGLGISMVQNIPTLLASRDSGRVLADSAKDMASEYSGAVPQNESWQIIAKRFLQPMLPIRLGTNDTGIIGNAGIIAFIFALFGLTAWRRKNFPWQVVAIAVIVAPFALIPSVNNASYMLVRAMFILPYPPYGLFGILILILSAVGVKHWTEIASTKKPIKFTFSAEYLPVVIGIFVALAGSLFIGRESFVPNGSPILLTIASAVLIISAFFISNLKQFNIAIGAIAICALYSAIVSGTYVLADVPSPNARNPMPETEIFESLKNLTNPESGDGWGRIIRYSSGPVNVMSITDQPYIFLPNIGTYFGIPDAFGYHNLAPKSRLELIREIQPETIIKRRLIAFFTPPVDLYDQRLFNMGVRYVLTDSEIEGFVPEIESDRFLVYDLYDQPGHDSPPLRVSVIPSIETNDSGGRINPEVLSIPEIKLDEPGHFITETNSESPGLLIFNEGYANGWTVKVDGKNRELKIHENFSIAVEIEGGRHTVEFQYFMPGWKSGMAITSASLLLWVALGIFITFRRKTSPP